MAADLASQWALEQELAREGLDRAALDPDELTERADAAARIAADEVGAALGRSAREVVVPPVSPDGLAEAARAAFVALYEAGMVERTDAVAWRCPRCGCGLGPGDVRSVPGETPVAVILVGTAESEGGEATSLEVEHAAVELLAAVTAVGVPPGHTLGGAPAAGRQASVPLLEAPVPVVEDPALAGPTLLTPGHDPVHHDVGRRHGLAVTVLAEEVAPFAAREAALERLAAEGRLVGLRAGPDEVPACAHCGTVAVARLAPHWVLDEELGGPWCLERELWRGVPLPVGWCADCAKPTVAVGPADLGACGICFGELRPEPGVIDPLFVVAAWAAEAARGQGATFVGGGREWQAAAVALALRLDVSPLSVIGPDGAGVVAGGTPA